MDDGWSFLFVGSQGIGRVCSVALCVCSWGREVGRKPRLMGGEKNLPRYHSSLARTCSSLPPLPRSRQRHSLSAPSSSTNRALSTQASPACLLVARRLQGHHLSTARSQEPRSTLTMSARNGARSSPPSSSASAAALPHLLAP